MILHRRVHENLDVPDCFGCRIASVGFSAETMPTRKPTEASTVARERVLSKDLDAYPRLLANGVQPGSVMGAAKLEATANTKTDIEKPGV